MTANLCNMKLQTDKRRNLVRPPSTITVTSPYESTATYTTWFHGPDLAYS